VNTVNTARTAGLLYLIVVLTGIFSLGYVPSQVAGGDPGRTLSSIAANETLFRLGIAAGLTCYVAFLVLPLALYRLLGHVDRAAAVMMVAFAAASVPISMVNTIHRLEILTLIRGVDYPGAFTPGQLNGRVLLALDQYRNGLLVSEIFWGLWLLPLGYLVFTSRMLPRMLGVLLMVGCFGYLATSFGAVLGRSMPGYVTLPAALGEIGTCLWLLIMGARPAAVPSTWQHIPCSTS
jgi:hypothetical protein